MLPAIPIDVTIMNWKMILLVAGCKQGYIWVANANPHHDPVGCLIFRTHPPAWLFLLFFARLCAIAALKLKAMKTVDLTSNALKMLKVQPPTDLRI
jgi:hypothetical protein